MDAALKSMLHDPVSIAPYQGQDAYGSPLYGSPTQYMGRVERHFETQMGPNGAELTEETVLYLPENTIIDERSQLTLDGRVVPIEALQSVQDELGNIDHYKVML